MFFAELKEFATISLGNLGYISVMSTLKVTYLVIKGIPLFENNRGISLIGYMFIL